MVYTKTFQTNIFWCVKKKKNIKGKNTCMYTYSWMDFKWHEQALRTHLKQNKTKQKRIVTFQFISDPISHSGTPPRCLCSTWGCWVLQQCSRRRPKALVQDLSLWRTAVMEGGREGSGVLLGGQGLLHQWIQSPAKAWMCWMRLGLR